MTTPKPKFLLIVNDMAWFWSHRLPLARAILERGWDLHLATNNAAGDPAIKEMNIIGHDLPGHTGSLNPLGQLALMLAIYKSLKETKPDMVHAITVRHAFYTGLMSRLTRSPCVVFTVAGLGSLFNSDDPKIKLIRAFVVPLFKIAFGGKGRFVIFQNPDDARALVKGGAVAKDRCTIIKGSGVDMAEFPFTPEPANDHPVILFSSRLLKAKGIGEFVHAARILKSKGVQARFQVAGDIAPGNHDTVTREQLDDWIAEGVIEWLGQRRDMPSVMAQSNIVTLPSYYGEGVPKVLLEAAAIGRAIVTTDMPGCRETVDNGVSGILVEAKNSWSLAEGLESLLNDPDKRKQMGEAGRKRTEADFSVEKVTTRTMAVYAKLRREEA